MTDADPLEVAAWHREAGDLRAEDLPTLATDALVRGLDSPSLRILAGQNPRDIDVSRELFAEVIAELNVPVPSTDKAIWCLVRLTAERIVDRRTSAIEGAHWIALHAALEVEEEGDLRFFIGLLSEIDDYPGVDIPTIEQEIIATCTELLERTAPRRWIQLRAASGRLPLTHHGLQGQVDVAAADLGLDAQLADDLSTWARSYDTTLGHWPSSGGFTSRKQALQFVDQGRDLTGRLQVALGPNYVVEYSPEPVDRPGVKLAKSRGWFSRRRRS